MAVSCALCALCSRTRLVLIIGPAVCVEESTYFLSVNKNKRSITIDFQKEKGRQLVLDLAAKCDVLVENFTPGKLAKHGLG